MSGMGWYGYARCKNNKNHAGDDDLGTLLVKGIFSAGKFFYKKMKKETKKQEVKQKDLEMKEIDRPKPSVV